MLVTLSVSTLLAHLLQLQIYACHVQSRRSPIMMRISGKISANPRRPSILGSSVGASMLRPNTIDTIPIISPMKKTLFKRGRKSETSSAGGLLGPCRAAASVPATVRTPVIMFETPMRSVFTPATTPPGDITAIIPSAANTIPMIISVHVRLS